MRPEEKLELVSFGLLAGRYFMIRLSDYPNKKAGKKQQLFLLNSFVRPEKGCVSLSGEFTPQNGSSGLEADIQKNAICGKGCDHKCLPFLSFSSGCQRSLQWQVDQQLQRRIIVSREQPTDDISCHAQDIRGGTGNVQKAMMSVRKTSEQNQSTSSEFLQDSRGLGDQSKHLGSEVEELLNGIRRQ
ncbi:hypothetical protein [Kiloniella sp. b19]|uniref:hypothetical protein n=1 Tax=Kiloniella sp. GXU_MW_B19 TaxID=3141326 RepID=UPI0031DFD084